MCPVQYLSPADPAPTVSSPSGEFAVIENPPGVFPAREPLPFGPKATTLPRGLAAALIDMDGTTSSTEPLYVHALEEVARHAAGKVGDPTWPNFDLDREYPDLIGCSTHWHVDYVLQRNPDVFDVSSYRAGVLAATAFNLRHAGPHDRYEAFERGLVELGAEDAVNDPRFAALEQAALDDPEALRLARELGDDHADRISFDTFADRLTGGVSIYMAQVNAAMTALERGEAGPALEAARERIGPMPGVAVLLSLLKGWLGAEAAALYPRLTDDSEINQRYTRPDADAGAATLERLGRRFASTPARVALVTSSPAYEARIVLREVLRQMRGAAAAWPVSPGVRARIEAGYEDAETFYDGFFTGDVVGDLRLKPHRDLYAHALYTLGISPEDFDRVLAFEDSEAGTIAIRAAGIPLCCALPSVGHGTATFPAATVTCPGGLSEVLLSHGLFITTADCAPRKRYKVTQRKSLVANP